MMTVVAFLAWFAGLSRLGVERTGLLTGLLPVATLVTAAVQDRFCPSPLQAGAVLLVAGALGVAMTGPAPRARGMTGPAPRARRAGPVAAHHPPDGARREGRSDRSTDLGSVI